MQSVELTFAGTLSPQAVLNACDRAAELVEHPEIEIHWTQESSCEGMSVGGLTRHLIKQILQIVDYLGTVDPSADAARRVSLMEHYELTVWIDSGISGDTDPSVLEQANADILERANVAGREGIQTARKLLSEARRKLPGVLAHHPDEVFIPWTGWCLGTEDFLVARLVEIVVHCDDLAVSVDLPTPQFSWLVLDPVFHLLTTLAARSHGQDSVVRMLARPQRALESISVF